MNRSGNIFVCLYVALLLAAGVGRAETVFWSDGFETNTPSRWTTNTVWKIGSPTTGPPINSAGYRTYSGTNCATTPRIRALPPMLTPVSSAPITMAPPILVIPASKPISPFALLAMV